MDVKTQWIDKSRLDSAENTIRNIRRNYPECSKKDKDRGNYVGGDEMWQNDQGYVWLSYKDKPGNNNRNI